jgi:hypothetical protein
VIAGAPLADVAARAGVPMWLRAFPAEAFAAPLPALPDHRAFRRRIANHMPKTWRLAPRWIENVGLAFNVGDEDIAVWFAREAPLKDKKRPRYARKRRSQNRRLVALWAWFSKRPGELAHAFTTPLWRPDLQWRAALDAATAWRNAAALRLYLAGGVSDMWLEEGVVDGYAFVALRTAAEIDAEAEAMKHCIRTYGASIAGNDTRLWGVRRDGERVATLSVAGGQGPWPYITEISGRENKAVANDVWFAARRWLHNQDGLPVDAARLAYKDATFDAAAWRAFWRTYWIAKRRIPAWLPLRPSENAFYDL